MLASLLPPLLLTLFSFVGVSLSLGHQNGLLRLLAWDGVGNTSSAGQHKKQEEQGNEEEAGLRGVDQEDSEEAANSSGTGVGVYLMQCKRCINCKSCNDNQPSGSGTE